jgi:hypothetical protein
MPLSCPKTGYNHSKIRVKNAKSALLNINKLADQITTFLEVNSFPDGIFISVSVDVMTMSPNRSSLPSNATDYSFVIYGQLLDRRFQCLPLHVITGDSARATEKVRGAVDVVCDSLTRRIFVVKHHCADGDPRYHGSHKVFFAERYPLFVTGDCQQL